MSLAPGTRIGAYEIKSPLGAGGMGEVYRARDTKLGRQVAVKILPDDVLRDPARVARFQREAQALAALNHPHIAQIYGFDDTSDIHALVMELVEGPTLADRIAQGPIPLDEALPIARQLAEALEAAHEQGIIHRDLKPANIKVRPDGTVKVLDFGLAKLLGPAEAGPYERQGVGAGFSRLDGTASPTITSPAMMTGAGMLLGTAAYMAPEQARGKAVDKRADIWAFGCVVYEMLTGRRAFAADEVSDTLAMVLMKEPDWSHLPPATPAAIRTLLRRCLEKDRKRRLPDIGVARLEIDELGNVPVLAATHIRVHRGRQGVAWIVAAAASVAAIGVSALHFLMERPSAIAAPIQFQISPPVTASFPPGDDPARPQAMSPDGRHIVFAIVTATGGQARLALHTFETNQARELLGTEAAAHVFWSPDSRFVGFFADGKLKKIDIVGGPPQILCDVPEAPTGATWSAGGTIVFGQGNAGLLRVSSGGGIPVPVTRVDAAKNESSHRHPWFLPNGRHFLYYSHVPTPVKESAGSGPASSIYVGSLDDGPPVYLLASDSKARFADDFLLFIRDETLLAQPFDTTTLSTTGDPVVVAENIPANVTTGSAAFSAAASGVVSYRSRSAEFLTQLTWVDRSGRAVGIAGDKADQAAINLARDGTRVAVSVRDPARFTRDIWIHDLKRNIRTRFTFSPTDDWTSAWSPDGRTLLFSAVRSGPLDIYRKAADGSTAEVPLVEGIGNKYVNSWSPDGRFVLFHVGAGAGSQTGIDLWVLPLSNDSKPRPFLQTPFNESDGQFSPDGRWVAYRSNESGQDQVYVVRFENPGAKWQVSSMGGNYARWRRDGKEMFYFSGNALMSAEVNGEGSAFQVGAVRRLFEVQRRTENYLGFGNPGVYEVAPDGQRFLVNLVGEQDAMPAPITIITNWTATLR